MPSKHIFIMVTAVASLLAIIMWNFRAPETQQPIAPVSAPSTISAVTEMPLLPLPEVASKSTPTPAPGKKTVATPTSQELAEPPAILTFLELPEKFYHPLPESCVPPLEALAQEYDIDTLDIHKLTLEYENWNQSRGGRDYAEVGSSYEIIASDYDAYSDDTLHELAEQGDMLANQIIGQKIMNQSRASHESLEKAERYFTQAAIYGSSQSLINLIALEQRRKIFAKQEKQKGNEIQANINARAWSEVARLRGGINLQIKFSASITGHLTEEQKQQAHKKADALYQSLNGMREHRGLSPFDNSLPLAVHMINRTTAVLEDCNELK